MDARDPSRRIAENPFYVLELPADCSRVEVERQGQKLIGMLEVGLSAARTYATPLGQHERTADKVRAAMAELRDPERRLHHELWARLAPDHLGKAPEDKTARAARDRAPGFGGASVRLGWRCP